jgi:hypothetical protein
MPCATVAIRFFSAKYERAFTKDSPDKNATNARMNANNFKAFLAQTKNAAA